MPPKCLFDGLGYPWVPEGWGSMGQREGRIMTLPALSQYFHSFPGAIITQGHISLCFASQNSGIPKLDIACSVILLGISCHIHEEVGGYFSQR